MAKLVFGMNQSLDGYVDHMAFAPSPTLFRHFIEEAQGLAGSVYGRQMYEVMRYWDDDHPEWNAEERPLWSRLRPIPSAHRFAGRTAPPGAHRARRKTGSPAPRRAAGTPPRAIDTRCNS